ncbi:MAG: hypothetical protein K9J06_08385 [Flavobacteriales bacterium]|nr:hypothetical protein [Flavobacteriales bacterium]
MIRSLGSNEVFTFKTSHFLNSGKWKHERNLLFDTLLTTGESKLAKRLGKVFGNSPYLSTLKKERHRMYHALISCLLEQRRQQLEASDPWVPFEEARMLLDKGFIVQAADRASAGISRAEEVHDLHAALALRELLRSIYKLMPRSRLEMEITDNEYRLENVIRQVSNLARYTTINDRLYDLQKKYRLADDVSVRDAMDALMADELMTDMKHAISLPAQIRFASIKAFYAQCSSEYATAIDHFNLCLTLWERSAPRIAYLPHLYREVLANLIGLLNLAGDRDLVPILLKRMEQIPVSGQRSEMLAFCDNELQYQLFYMNTGRFKEVIAREEAVNKGRDRFAALILESKELTLLYNLGVTHFMMGHDKQAYRYFSCIRDKGALQSRLDIQGTARIFCLLLLMEKEDTGGFSYLLRSSKRARLKHMPFYRMQDAVYKWLGKHQNDFYSPDRDTFLMQLHETLLPFEQERVLGAEEIRLWALSRASGRPITPIIEGQ